MEAAIPVAELGPQKLEPWTETEFFGFGIFRFGSR
jgi:hypothetical protein